MVAVLVAGGFANLAALLSFRPRVADAPPDARSV
jgi:hypothetical protein